MTTYVHLDSSQPYRNYVYYFSDVDLADLVTLIDWSDTVEVQDIGEIGGYLTQQGTVPDGLSPDEASAVLEHFYGLEPADYVSPSEAKKPPKKRNKNIIMGWYAEFLPNNKWIFTRASYDKTTKTFRPFDGNASKKPFDAEKTIRGYMGSWRTPTKVVNGELVGIVSGTYLAGKKIR